MRQDIIIKPMTKDFILYRCLWLTSFIRILHKSAASCPDLFHFLKIMTPTIIVLQKVRSIIVAKRIEDLIFAGNQVESILMWV